ncbi:PorP/SprF family type IX secretion system membrane protein [Rubrolithibacter danxiaensis]|uniref:PorP/SprF family type IX secretion system membrane protein n=1 Tax=Rubrolithibacter danxiaensis TaxID=3390805 RepID=UPI003BF8816D
MGRIIRAVFLFITLLYSIAGNAQDHIYSQFFNSPLYLNPALNGQFKGDLRFNIIYRNQWASVPGVLRYLSASIDYQIPNNGGGAGLLFNRSNEGTAYLQKNNLAAIYSYTVGGGDFNASLGIQGGFTNSRIDFSKLIFSDQIDPSTGYTEVPSEASQLNNNVYYFDAGAGVNFVIKNAMIGASMLHLNKPDESFTGSNVKVPVRSIVHASYRFSLNKYESHEYDGTFLIPSVVVYNQAQINSYSAGIQFKHQILNAGLWYRKNRTTGDAFVVSLIFDIFSPSRFNKLRLGISHDATVSKINYSNTGGTTELSMGYETTFPNSDSDYNPYSGRKCYDFY